MKTDTSANDEEAQALQAELRIKATELDKELTAYKGENA